MARHQPNNVNPLHQNKFDMTFTILPNVDYFGWGINLPGIQLPIVDNTGTPFTKMKVHGDHIQWDDLEVNFVVDEEFQAWFEIFTWMQGLGFPQRFTQFKDRKEGKTLPSGVVAPKEPLYSDATLIIQTSSKNPNIEVTFTNISPVSLGGLEFSGQNPDTETMSSTASFAYDYYEIKVAQD